MWENKDERGEELTKDEMKQEWKGGNKRGEEMSWKKEDKIGNKSTDEEREAVRRTEEEMIGSERKGGERCQREERKLGNQKKAE